MKNVPPVRPKDGLSADHQNHLVGNVNELAAAEERRLYPLALFEATTGLTYNDPLDGEPPYCSVKRLWYSKQEGKVSTDYTARTERAYMPTANTDGSDVYLGTAHIVSGDRFWCVANRQTGRWEIVSYETGYDRCTCLLDGAMAEEDSTATVDNVKVISGSSPLDDPTDMAEELTVYNTHDHKGDDDGLARIEWNKTEERWEFYQVTCPA